jgi:hypothetical protein
VHHLNRMGWPIHNPQTNVGRHLVAGEQQGRKHLCQQPRCLAARQLRLQLIWLTAAPQDAEGAHDHVHVPRHVCWVHLSVSTAPAVNTRRAGSSGRPQPVARQHLQAVVEAPVNAHDTHAHQHYKAPADQAGRCSVERMSGVHLTLATRLIPTCSLPISSMAHSKEAHSSRLRLPLLRRAARAAAPSSVHAMLASRKQVPLAAPALETSTTGVAVIVDCA